jgi:acyl-coenzyme A thioesterase PaaI-like protein
MPGDLKCVARVVKLGGTNSVAEAYVYDGDEKLIASGRGTYFTAAAKPKE